MGLLIALFVFLALQGLMMDVVFLALVAPSSMPGEGDGSDGEKWRRRWVKSMPY